MSINVEKINSLLKSGDFVEKLKADLSNEGIVKTFGGEGIKLENKDAQDFKKVISGLYEMKDNDLDVSGGVSIEGGFKNIGKGIGGMIGGTVRGVGTVIGGVAKGVGTVAGSTVKGIGRTVWGAAEVPLSLVYDVGKGIYEGGKEGLGIK